LNAREGQDAPSDPLRLGVETGTIGGGGITNRRDSEELPALPPESGKISGALGDIAAPHGIAQPSGLAWF